MKQSKIRKLPRQSERVRARLKRRCQLQFGIGGVAGAIGGMIIAKLVAYIRNITGSYVPIFAIVVSAYPVALLIIHLLAPRLEPAQINYDQI
jgi:nitrate/nitrite transporter NarK